MDEFVSLSGLKRMTGYTQRAAQKRMLEQMGVPYRVQGREVLVLAIHMQEWMEGRPMRRHAAPNMNAIR